MLGNVIVYRPPFAICRVRIGRQVSPGVVKCRQVAPAPGGARWRQVAPGYERTFRKRIQRMRLWRPPATVVNSALHVRSSAHVVVRSTCAVCTQMSAHTLSDHTPSGHMH